MQELWGGGYSGHPRTPPGHTLGRAVSAGCPGCPDFEQNPQASLRWDTHCFSSQQTHTDIYRNTHANTDGHRHRKIYSHTSLMPRGRALHLSLNYNNLKSLENSLAVQWLGLHASTAGGTVSIPGQGTKIMHAMGCGKKKKKNLAEDLIISPVPGPAKAG